MLTTQANVYLTYVVIRQSDLLIILVVTLCLVFLWFQSDNSSPSRVCRLFAGRSSCTARKV